MLILFSEQKQGYLMIIAFLIKTFLMVSAKDTHTVLNFLQKNKNKQKTIKMLASLTDTDTFTHILSHLKRLRAKNG